MRYANDQQRCDSVTVYEWDSKTSHPLFVRFALFSHNTRKQSLFHSDANDFALKETTGAPRARARRERARSALTSLLK